MTALEFTYTVGAELTAAGIASLIAKTKGKITFRFPTWREVITTTMLSALLISYIFSRGSLGWLSLSILVAAFLIPTAFILVRFTKNDSLSSRDSDTDISHNTTIISQLKPVPATLGLTNESKASCIYVFRPDPKRKSEKAFYQDGDLQDQGFRAAEEEAKADGIHHMLDVRYHAVDQSDSGETIINLMKKYYADENATYFIITMSSMARRVRNCFFEWNQECASTNQRLPILIVTVASAPDLTIASTPSCSSVCIVRWYVRSQEESSLLSLYFRWKLGVDKVAVFHEKDSYGKHGKDEFRDRFGALGGHCLECYSITADEARSKVSEFLAKYGVCSKLVGVLVIGYGNTLRKTVEELIAQKFSGIIACASTLTGPEWQPSSRNADERIVTVLPRMKRPLDKLTEKDRDVVYYFAKWTLYRVIQISAKNPDPTTFVDRWRKYADNSRLRELHLADGDTVIQLDIADNTEQWR